MSSERHFTEVARMQVKNSPQNASIDKLGEEKANVKMTTKSAALDDLRTARCCFRECFLYGLILHLFTLVIHQHEMEMHYLCYLPKHVECDSSKV